MINKLISVFFMGIVISGGVLADAHKPCTRQAMDELNKSNMKYINYFIQQNNKEALLAIESIRPSKAFVDKHSKELKTLSSDRKYTPTPRFCNDIYIEVANMNEQLETVAEKYGYPEDK